MRINKNELKNQQYKNADNLSARQAIYRYSENPEPFWEWVAKYYPVLPNYKILEVGCGNGLFWRDAVRIFPRDIQVTLTDFSEGMLNEAKKNLSEISNFKYSVEDVEHLSYPDKCFDTVLAHFMLYHANSPQKALSEIKRVLKPGGFCGIILSGENYMQTLFSIVKCENPRQARFFSAEIAVDVLPEFFPVIEKYEYKDNFKILDIALLLNYIRSLPGMNDRSEDFYTLCNERLTNHIRDNGSVELSSTQYLFIAR